MVLLLLTFCLLLLPLWESVIVLCFVVRYFMSILVMQSSWWGRESWLLCLICLPGVSWWLNGSSSRCHGVVCSLWLWYYLIILTYYFWHHWIKVRHACSDFQKNWMEKNTCLSHDLKFPTMWYVGPAKVKISLRIRAVWSEPFLVACLRLLTKHYLEFISLKEAAQARLSLHMSNCHIVGNHMSLLISEIHNTSSVFMSCS